MPAGKYPLEIVVKAIDEATRPFRRIQAVIDRTMTPFAKFRVLLRLNYAESGISKVAGAMRNLGSQIGAATTAAAGLVGRLALVSGGTAAGIFAFARSFAVSGDEIAKTSLRLGISTDQLQALRYAAESSGIATSKMDAALENAKQRVLEVAHGVGEARGAFFRLGVQVRDAQGQIRPLSELLPEIADGLAGFDAATRNLIVSKIFGSSDLVPLLAGGSAALGEMLERWRELGGGFTEKLIKLAERFIGSLTDMKEAFKSIGKIAAEILLPRLAEFFGRLTTWITENRERIREFAQGFMESLPGRIESLKQHLSALRDRLQPVIEKMTEWASWLSENDRWVGILAAGVGLLAALIAAPLITALAAVIPAIIAVGAAILTTPIGWILLGIAGVVGAVVWLGEHWDWLGEKVDVAISWIVEKLKWLRDNSIGVLEDVGSFFAGIFGAGGEVEVDANTSSAPGSQLTREKIYGLGPTPGGPDQDGEIVVRFENTPPGAVVEPGRGGKAIRTDVDYRLGPAYPEAAW